MKKIILTIGVFVGFLQLTTAQSQRGLNSSQPSTTTDTAKVAQPMKPRKINGEVKQMQKTEIKDTDFKANDALFRSEDKSSEKLRKEIIK